MDSHQLRQVGRAAASSRLSSDTEDQGLKRDIDPDYEFDPRNLEPLARCLRSTLMALGHAASAYNCFVKIKSRDVSPDGLLGGQGFVQSIVTMRRQFAGCVEALSALSDTLYDEMKAPHWSPEAQQQAENVMDDVEDLREDPEGWAEDVEGVFDETDDGVYEDDGDGEENEEAGDFDEDEEDASEENFGEDEDDESRGAFRAQER